MRLGSSEKLNCKKDNISLIDCLIMEGVAPLFIYRRNQQSMCRTLNLLFLYTLSTVFSLRSLVTTRFCSVLSLAYPNLLVFLIRYYS